MRSSSQYRISDESKDTNPKDVTPAVEKMKCFHCGKKGYMLTNGRVRCREHYYHPPMPASVVEADGAKDTNPKDGIGVRKWRQFCTVPFTIIWELGAAMLEGSFKYGRHNYRVAGVRASIYIDAAMGHLTQWWEGEDIDLDSGLNHITKAMGCLAVLRDAMINDLYVDDRPPKCKLDKARSDLQKAVDKIFDKYPNPENPYTEINKGEPR